jgi:hypothetical protein
VWESLERREIDRLCPSPPGAAGALAGPAAAAVGAHAFLTGSAVVMAVAGVAFTLVPALRADASAGPQGERLE